MKIVAFLCENSGYIAAQAAAGARIRLPEGLQFIKLPCSGKVDELYLMKAFEGGADGVIVAACQKDACRFLEGNLRAERTVAEMGMKLQSFGIAPHKVRFIAATSNQGREFAEKLLEFAETLKTPVNA